MIDTKELRRDADDAYVAHVPLEICGGELIELLDRLEAAEKECESWKGLSQQYDNEADGLRTHLSFAKDELNRLRAKIEAMEKQEPVKIQHRVPFLDSNGECVGYTTWKDGRGFDHWPHRSLYLAPGAIVKGEEK